MSSSAPLPACDPTGPACRGQARKLLMLCREVGLTRQDRLDLAHMVLGWEVSTFKELSHADAGRLLDVVAGFGFICHLLTTQQRDVA